ncbi:oxidoreductase [Nocardiopsis dassonvillei]|uniref:NmrA family protein n=2 Tax=Nocardiopsis TaxID=2013 RepID=D7B657_NOCDD|nr:oxidoreductase [Nocardiopsis dassonvillei]ADH67322.1 NmrA family protein [Nocardiopsis dassonvillei subsp. dassonvillei DSM 43111]APC35537.1 ergot alkaloid biosynthesis protein [Nocardiopsis dassonvillei]NKY77325.1 ergot alkaloid biosynthesis protein [Nocardiopsis dassonvillei]VEI87450.1 NAD(P)H azoreductase [Nocardiopsis dassonvillei]
MSILVTGGTGNTGRPLTETLRARGAHVRVASRGPGPGGVPFDWADPDTHARALDGARALYLVPPPMTLDPMPAAGPFLAAARAAGVRRVVLLGSLARLSGAPGVAELGEAVRSFPEWAVLRPSGFMQNFTGAHPVAAGIRERGEIRSATGEGKLGWIDAADIAAVAAQLLLAPGPVAGEHVLTGPESFGYARAAAVIAEATGRPVRHTPAPAAELVRRNLDAGMSEPFASALVRVDADIAGGSEDLVTDTVHRLTGRPPRTFADFVRARPREWSAA